MALCGLRTVLVGSDPEELVRLLHASYGVHFVVYAKLFDVFRRCRSKTLPFIKALPSSTIRRLRTDPTLHILGSQRLLEGTF